MVGVLLCHFVVVLLSIATTFDQQTLSIFNLNHTPTGFAPLHISAMSGHTDMTKLLLEHKANVNLTTKEAGSPLSQACDEGFVEVARLLIAAGARVNYKDPSTLESALHLAAEHGNLALVKLLVDSHAELNGWDEEGRTPLTRAIRKRRNDVVAYLRSVGAKEKSADSGSESAESESEGSESD